MQAQQEKETWQKYRQQGDSDARQWLFAHYQDWAQDEARRIFGQLNVPGAQLDEFSQWAFQGLLEAIERFDPDKDIGFKSFAIYRIRGIIFSGLPSLSESSAFYANRGRYLPSNDPPTAAPDTADGAEPVSTLVSMVMTMAVEYLLKEGGSEMTQLTGEFYSSPEINTIAQRIRDHVYTLEEPMRSVISLYYFGDNSFDQVAKTLEFSNARISQLHQQAIKTLKNMAGW